jgi:hypothetical protein
MSILPESGLTSSARGVPSPGFLPVEALAECAARAIRRDGRVALNHGSPAGYGPLREWLAVRHGVAVERVVVTLPPALPTAPLEAGLELRRLPRCTTSSTVADPGSGRRAAVGSTCPSALGW